MGEIRWRVHRSSLYYFCKFLWLYNYFKIKSLKKSTIMVDLYIPWATILWNLEGLQRSLHHPQSKCLRSAKRQRWQEGHAPWAVHAGGAAGPSLCPVDSDPMSHSQCRLPSPPIPGETLPPHPGPHSPALFFFMHLPPNSILSFFILFYASSH